MKQLLVIIALFILAACGGELAEPTATPTTPPPTEAPTDPPPTEAPTDPPPTEVVTAAPTTDSSEASAVPEGMTRWILSNDPIETTSTEACAEPLLFDFYGPAVVETTGESIVWTRPSGPTTLDQSQQDPTVYQGSSQSPLEAYDLTIDVNFLGEGTLLVTHTMTDQAAPDCVHTFVYSAEQQ